MEIVEKNEKNVLILAVKGEIDLHVSPTLRTVLKAKAQANTPRLLLNFAEVAYIDSSGLGALVMSYSTLKKKDGMLKLLNLTRRNVELLVLTKLETVFEVFDDEQNAVNSFFPNREIKKFDILAFLQQRKKGAGE